MPIPVRVRFAAFALRFATVRSLAALSALAFGILFQSASHAAELVLTDAAYGKVNSAGIDQPRLYFLVSDPAADDAFVTWFDPTAEAVQPALFTAFIDTGASGFAISHLHISGEYDQPALGLSPATTGDFIGPFTEVGIGGAEPGDVTRPLGIWVSNLPLGASEDVPLDSFVPFGDFNLWARRETGVGEVVSAGELGSASASPLNLVGMPVIRQRRLLLDVTPMQTPNELGVPNALVTALLAPGAAEPATQATVPLILRDFIGDTPPAGEVLLSHYANPLVPGLTLTHGSVSVTGEWLLDTGAGSSFASFATAKAAGLIPAHYATLAEFMADYTGPKVSVGGIGSSQDVPALTVDRLSMPTREGGVLVWENVTLLVLDVAGLDGIVGMNLFVPALAAETIDMEKIAKVLAALQSGDLSVDIGDLLQVLIAMQDLSPSPVSAVVIDTTNAANPVMRLATPAAAGTIYAWISEKFTPAERAEAAIGSLWADPDGDGLANLLEYALGLDPRTANVASAASIASVIRLSGEQHLALSYERPAGGLPDVDYRVEVSRDLVSWSHAPADFTADIVALPGSRERVTARAIAPLEPRLFIRLTVSLAP